MKPLLNPYHYQPIVQIPKVSYEFKISPSSYGSKITGEYLEGNGYSRAQDIEFINRTPTEHLRNFFDDL